MKISTRLQAAAFLVLGFTGSASHADEATIRAALEKMFPDSSIERISAAPVAGLYEVVVGPNLFYVSSDSRYLIQGHVLDLETKADLTEAKLAQSKKIAVDKIPEDKMIIFAPEQVKHTITVFTDIDCGYCRKLHKEIDDFLKEGIRVRYLFFPRAGVGSPSYDKAVSVWCAKDRKQAFTDAKAGKDPEAQTCDNPVREQMVLGERMGVTGTPAILFEDGRLLPGYVPAKRMAMFFNSAAQ